MPIASDFLYDSMIPGTSRDHSRRKTRLAGSIYSEGCRQREDVPLTSDGKWGRCPFEELEIRGDVPTSSGSMLSQRQAFALNFNQVLVPIISLF